ncbi:hypothetical protein FH583_00170 [Leptospira interrogans]|uniref:hypothetical protein n=1 Tax=Leptospira interrogans TaxID=173 RepID=UPI00036EA684|nr:hypothetical protein [Leptospira interrogans]UML74499.1 hypothetical protein FH583_00170 [Leptospira interrogans]
MNIDNPDDFHVLNLLSVIRIEGLVSNIDPIPRNNPEKVIRIKKFSSQNLFDLDCIKTNKQYFKNKSFSLQFEIFSMFRKEIFSGFCRIITA